MSPLSSGKPARQVFAEDDRKTVQWLLNEQYAHPLSAEEGEQMLLSEDARAWSHDLFVYRREGMELADHPLRIEAAARFLWRERGILYIPISLLPALAGTDKLSRHSYYRPVSTSTVPPAYVMRRLGLPWCTPLQARWKHVGRMSAAVWGLADMPWPKGPPTPGPDDPPLHLASRRALDGRGTPRMGKELERRLAEQERASYDWPALKEALRQEGGQSKQPLTFYVNEFLFTVNANPTHTSP